MDDVSPSAAAGRLVVEDFPNALNRPINPPPDAGGDVADGVVAGSVGVVAELEATESTAVVLVMAKELAAAFSLTILARFLREK